MSGKTVGALRLSWLLLLLASCVESSGDGERPASATESWTVAAEPVLVIGDRVEEPGHILEAVRRALVVDDMLVLADARANELRAFDFEGDLRWSAGRGGEGPGEFSPWILGLFPWPGDTLAVSDATRIHLFTTSGVFGRTLTLPSSGVRRVLSGRSGPNLVLRESVYAGGIPESTGFRYDSTALVLAGLDGGK